MSYDTKSSKKEKGRERKQDNSKDQNFHCWLRNPSIVSSLIFSEDFMIIK